MWLGTMCTWVFAPIAWMLWPSGGLPPMTTAIISVAACIEATTEPLYANDLVAMDMKHRALAEGLGLILRSLAVLVTISQGVTAFAVAQVVYALAVVCIMRLLSGAFPWNGLKLTPDTFQILCTEFGLSILKFILSEGEKLVLLFFSSASSEQGVYALVSSLGSIITRNLFQPIEVRLDRKPHTAS